MTVLDINRIGELTVYETRFWQVVQDTLVRVFNADPDLAIEYRSHLKEAPPLERALALHDEPLDIAATLVGKPLTADRIALYDIILVSLPQAATPIPFSAVVRPENILSSTRREERAPMVDVATLNKFVRELGYGRLTISGGNAYFLLDKKAWKRPLPKRLGMETLPGLTADREEVYGLDRVLNVLNGLQEFARRQRAASSIITRIEKMKGRIRSHAFPS